MRKISSDEVVMVFLLAVCVAALLAVLFFLTPVISEVLSIARSYRVRPDTWTYYAILASCVAALLGSFFMIFHHYLPRRAKNELERAGIGVGPGLMPEKAKRSS
ncbi:MAG: hypothetical protein C4536_05340 [Actinobacteria bacterium]|jgi:uncharacterized BrkB/YihY/UPF0761 family membrane protein|nr:MAG: hypothetical protein C4536_05340 [Actinomycetota bacterium]